MQPTHHGKPHKLLHAPFIALALCLAAGTAQAAPKAELWARWQAHDPDSEVSVDHAPWQAFLDRFVETGENGINRVDYAGVDDQAKNNLGQYLENLQATPVSQLNRPEQLAFWINLYNAQTLYTVLEHYPVESIRDIDISGFFSNGPWGAELLSVEGEALTLDDIEHRILRPIWRTPLIHYAVNCAALGCPNLQRQAFTADNTRALMTQAAFDYINHRRGVHFEDDSDLVVSSIYYWFAEDFGGREGILPHLKRYATPSLIKKLEAVDKIDDHDYDWALNDTR